MNVLYVKVECPHCGQQSMMGINIGASSDFGTSPDFPFTIKKLHSCDLGGCGESYVTEVTVYAEVKYFTLEAA